VFEINNFNDLTFDIRGGSGIASAQLFWRNGDAGAFNQIDMTRLNDTTFTAQIPRQTGGNLLYYMKATDTNNVSAFEPVGDSIHPYSAGVGASQFVDSLDHGYLYWQSGGVNDQWGLSAKYFHSGTLSLTDSPADNYRDNTDSWVQSRFALDLSRVTAASLSFYWRGVLQSGFDSLIVEASGDGANWNRFPQAISGTSTTWVQYSADLASYVGQGDVRLRLRLKTNASTRREGIYIDDITVAWNPTAIGDNGAPLPNIFALDQNYPNPFNPSTVISFTLGSKMPVELSVYDLLGRKVRILASGELPAGVHSVTWDGRNESGRDVASGVYLYKLKSGESSAILRMTLIR
jgi:hypothetical protein